MWPRLDAINAVRHSGSGKGVRIAILDSGIDQAHPALEAAPFVTPESVRSLPGGFVSESCDPEDVFGHGTAVAGIIHALAPQAELISIRVLDGHNRQHRHEVIKCGALRAIGLGAHILNCSFGMPGAAFSLPIYKSWTDHGFECDRHIVAASSNGDPDEPQWPAFFPQVLSVTAAAVAPEVIRYRPGSAIAFEAAGIDVAVLAPDKRSTVLTGSSFAAAHLSGLLARLLSEHPDTSPSFAHDALRRLAESNRKEAHA